MQDEHNINPAFDTAGSLRGHIDEPIYTPQTGVVPPLLVATEKLDIDARPREFR